MRKMVARSRDGGMATPVCKRTDSQDMGEKSTLFKLDGVEEGRRERQGGGVGEAGKRVGGRKGMVMQCTSAKLKGLFNIILSIS